MHYAADACASCKCLKSIDTYFHHILSYSGSARAGHVDISAVGGHQRGLQANTDCTWQAYD